MKYDEKYDTKQKAKYYFYGFIFAVMLFAITLGSTIGVIYGYNTWDENISSGVYTKPEIEVSTSDKEVLYRDDVYTYTTTINMPKNTTKYAMSRVGEKDFQTDLELSYHANLKGNVEVLDVRVNLDGEGMTRSEVDLKRITGSDPRKRLNRLAYDYREGKISQDSVRMLSSLHVDGYEDDSLSYYSVSILEGDEIEQRVDLYFDGFTLMDIYKDEITIEVDVGLGEGILGFSTTDTIEHSSRVFVSNYYPRTYDSIKDTTNWRYEQRTIITEVEY